MKRYRDRAASCTRVGEAKLPRLQMYWPSQIGDQYNAIRRGKDRYFTHGCMRRYALVHVALRDPSLQDAFSIGRRKLPNRIDAQLERLHFVLFDVCTRIQYVWQVCNVMVQQAYHDGKVLERVG